MKAESLQNMRDRAYAVRLEGLYKTFPSHDSGKEEVVAVDRINLTVEPGELVTLLGPSGCGKTTTLRMISGFESATSGSVIIGKRDVANVPPNKRDISMVFQNYALFPHLTVWDNVAYGLKLKNISKEEVTARTQKTVELMQLSGMEKRFPAQMSGGQQQRVALARAVVIEPKVLLFDEPLSNLDAKLREQMRDELRRLQQILGITSLYVTHDQSEAMAISDKVVIMKDGKIMQVGSPREIYERPSNRFVADFIGKSNFIEVVLEAGDESGAEVTIKAEGGRRLHIPSPGPMHGLKTGDTCYLSVRPEAIQLGGEGDFTVLIDHSIYYGDRVEYHVRFGQDKMIVQDFCPFGKSIFAEGETVGAVLDRTAVTILA